MRDFISQYDLVYEELPLCWQDGMLLGNGRIGSVFYGDENLNWIINKTDVIDGRGYKTGQPVPRAEAEEMVRAGARASDFERKEVLAAPPLGAGPKSCCVLALELGTGAGSGNMSAMPERTARLGLYDGTLYVNLDKHLYHTRVTSFIPNHDNLLIIRVSDVSPFVCHSSKIHLSRPVDVEIGEPKVMRSRGRLLLHMVIPDSCEYMVAVEVVPRKSTFLRDHSLLEKIRPKYRPQEDAAVQLSVFQGWGTAAVNGDFDVILAVVSSLEHNDLEHAVHAKLDSFLGVGFEEHRRRHCAFWEKFWSKSWVELGDKGWEQLYYQSLYTLGSSLSGTPIPGLTGLLYGPGKGPTQITPWRGFLHQDQNVQCVFFPLHAVNHSELVTPYLQTYAGFLSEARRIAKEVWNASGAHFDMTFTMLGKSLFGGVGKFRYFFAGSFVALIHCLTWRYTRDVHLLREWIYPFLVEILDFYLSILKKEGDTYTLWPAHTPELDILDTKNPVQNLSMLKVCLDTALEAAEILRDTREHVERWRDLRQHFPAYPIVKDDTGNRLADAMGVPLRHHISQVCGLYPVYPCGEFDGTEECLQRYRNTMDNALRRIALKSYAQKEGFYFNCIWQNFFIAASCLRLGRKREFWELYFPLFLASYSKPSGQFSHDATVLVSTEDSEGALNRIPNESLVDVDEEMQGAEAWYGHQGQSSPNPLAKAYSTPLLEGSSDYLSLITEALLQSHGGVIRVFPAWDDKRDAQFHRLMAEGNFLVSAKIKNDVVEFIRIERGPHAPEKVRLQSPWTYDIREYLVPEAGLTLSNNEPIAWQGQEPMYAIQSAAPRVLSGTESNPCWLGRKRG